MNIGIFGGAFNPIHQGHINLCRQCMQQFSLDRIILMPTNISPHKQNDELIDFSHRANMVSIAIEKLDNFSVTDIEYRRGGTSFTYDTIVDIKMELAGSTLYFIIGSDMLFSFHLWYNCNELLNEVILLAGARNKDELVCMQDYKKAMFNNTNRIQIANIDAMDISSTRIRRELKNGILPNDMVAPEVIDYIKDYDLYR